MLEITIPEQEFYVPATKTFVYTSETVLHLEHSLVSISKWEAKYKKPFLESNEKTVRESIDYIRCMTLDNGINPLVYSGITNEMISSVDEYIQDPMTATWFKEVNKPKRSHQVVTSELVYYWMTAFNIPFECECWHFNRLMTLIRICGEKNAKPKKMNKREAARRNTELNAARRKALYSSG